MEFRTQLYSDLQPLLEPPQLPDTGVWTIEEVLRTSPSIVVLAIQRASGELSVAPRRQSQLAVGDTLIVMGHKDELEAIHPLKTDV